MEGAFGTIQVTMPSKGFLRVRNSKGCAVRVNAGNVWVTEEGNLKDTLLHAGMHYRIGHEGLTLLQAFGEAQVTISPALTPAHRLELVSARPGSPAKWLRSLRMFWRPLPGSPREFFPARCSASHL